MPINKQDATRALELLEQYQTQLNATEDAKLRAAIERVIRIFKSKLFNALVEIQEFYEVTLLDENKSLEQKAMETQRVADRWADGPQSANGPTRQQKKPAAPSSPPLPPPDSSVGAFEVVLRRLAGQGFGFSIAGGVDEPHQPGDSRLFVTKVAPGGVAESDGRMSVGDVILAVNGVDVTSVSHEAAVSALKMSGAQLSLLMLRPPPQPQPALKPTAEAAPLPAEPPVTMETGAEANGGGGPLEVTLSKTARGLGFSIAGGTDNQHLPGDDSIFVTKVIDGGAAQHSGRIGFGDRLLAVDGRPLTACTHQEAVATLKATGDRVRLTVGKATPEEVALLIELDEAARLEEQEAEAAAAGGAARGLPGSTRPSGPDAQQRHAGFQGPPDGAPSSSKKSKGLGGLFGGGKKK
ncbi:hypothetical protein BOX15_Mlig020975g2 [Macrostomum lignano]|uniref:PDZ domain-containing protein n=1 Tax=Macrostomum lignano TaxID=282301 RepID=A0A267EH77_9PLAT|nr:hypothetical protein BOX15_Mlig020975g2 [Macrostomum lignano]